MTTPGDNTFDPAPQPPAPGGYPQYSGPVFAPSSQYGPPQYPVPPTAPYGGYPQYPQYPVPVGTNGLAIGSLIASSLGFFYGLPAIVGVVLGILALGQIKRTGQQGRGLAIAGIVVGGVFVVLILAFLVVFLLAIANSH